MDNGTEYAVAAELVALEANAEFIEPIRLALVAVSDQRNEHWRRYVAHVRAEYESILASSVRRDGDQP